MILADGLDRSRFAPSIIVFNGEGPWASLVPEGVPVTDLRRSGLRAALPALRKEMRKIAPDIVVSTMGYVNLGVIFLKSFVCGSSRYIVRKANALLQGVFYP